jgi:hypothetical protein
MPDRHTDSPAPSVAFEVATRRDRFTERAVNQILIVMTLIVNWVLFYAGFVRLWGLYLTLVFIFILLAVDTVRFSYTVFSFNENSSLPAYMNTSSFLQNDVRPFIVIWLVWWVVTQFFFLSGTTFRFWISLLVAIPMLVATLVVSVQQQGLALARALFPLLALLVSHWSLAC